MPYYSIHYHKIQYIKTKKFDTENIDVIRFCGTFLILKLSNSRAASEESSAISEQLAGKALELDKLVKRFKLYR